MHVDTVQTLFARKRLAAGSCSCTVRSICGSGSVRLTPLTNDEEAALCESVLITVRACATAPPSRPEERDNGE